MVRWKGRPELSGRLCCCGGKPRGYNPQFDDRKLPVPFSKDVVKKARSRSTPYPLVLSTSRG